MTDIKTPPQTPSGQPETTGKPRPILVKRDWLFSAALFVIIVFLWIGIGVYHALTKQTIPAPVRQQAAVLSTQADEQVLDQLEGRIRLSLENFSEEERVIFLPEGSGSNPALPSASASPSATPTVAISAPPEGP